VAERQLPRKRDYRWYDVHGRVAIARRACANHEGAVGRNDLTEGGSPPRLPAPCTGRPEVRHGPPPSNMQVHFQPIKWEEKCP
jgi:hypothetical protein